MSGKLDLTQNHNHVIINNENIHWKHNKIKTNIFLSHVQILTVFNSLTDEDFLVNNFLKEKRAGLNTQIIFGGVFCVPSELDSPEAFYVHV